MKKILIENMMEMEVEGEMMQFEDYFPSMVEGLGTEAFMEELNQGFHLLMDEEKGVITFESLRRSTHQLGLQEMGDEDIVWMLSEGDLDGDGALDLTEFCMLMFRLSPALIAPPPLPSTSSSGQHHHRMMEEHDMYVNDMEALLALAT